jgi:hypothetical protein
VPVKSRSGFEYVNRKGQRYYLCLTTTRTGGPRYVFSRAIVGSPVVTVPAGYEIAESVNGVVSLRRAGSCAIREDEIAAVRAALANHGHRASCRVDARKKEVVVYHNDRSSGIEFLARECGGVASIAAVRNRGPFSPVLRFILQDDAERTFLAQRMCYRGSVDGWLTLSCGRRLRQLANHYVPHIGKDSFFELM